MRRKIPSTAALVAFESAARHQSFTKAAEELALTQSAVCRQIAALEAFLGVELFRRTRRGVMLTEEGLSYGRRIAAQLDAVERDTLAVMGQQGSTSLELAVVPTFATQWLLPRLKDFQRLHPEVTVNLTNRTRPFLFADTEFDAALYFGDGDWPGTAADFLMRENPLPVCSPELLAPLDRLDAGQLAALPLLQQSTRPYAWRQWFGSLGLQVEGDMRGPRYELFSMLAQAAMHGMGVALIPPLMIERELAEGRLVVPLAHALQLSDKAYYLVIPERKLELAALRAFRAWLLDQAQRYRQEAGLA
ncbi:LysR family transcriptional regulator [Pseudomonas sp. MAP12]|uniref:LysR family transcriptional regulator n=1 Tax=Geopseudomonas aromaticivorans TaxID=2849492 RepID=A0ABS6MUH2_9GAMM|nr:LysR family transcriptional regulator [Pseudomonas aromaticivorans]MBV2132453.1 LysR family transcriptional regulator [Pseudomonas aromaticivorans]